MNSKAILLAGTLLTFFFATLLWSINFGGDFSSRQQDWASFGTYIGGVVSPVIASLSLYAFLKTLDRQRDQITQGQRQISQAQKHANLAQIESTIEKLESDYKEALSTYSISINNGDKDSFEKNGYFILNQPSGFVWDTFPTKQELEDQLKKGVRPFSRPKLIYTMFGQAGAEINQMRLYVEKHLEVSGGNILAKYYHRKYKTHHARLYEKGFVCHPWPAPE